MSLTTSLAAFSCSTFDAAMPDSARILQFPARTAAPLTTRDAMREARQYFEVMGEARAEDRRASLLGNPDVLLALCAILKASVDSSAAQVLGESEALYRLITAPDSSLGAFDERDYFAGESALIAATASRVLGQRSETEVWLDRAEAGFRHTLNPAPLLAGVSYQRLALRCEAGRCEEVAELAPLLADSFGRLSMDLERAKCVMLEGIALKQSGKHAAAIGRFESLRDKGLSDRDPGLLGLALANVAEIHVCEGRDELASKSYSEALPLLERGNRPAALAHTRAVIGETLRRQGELVAAIEAYKGAIAAYDALDMSTWVAYLQVVLAQALLEAGQYREAEWQIIAALPTIEAQRMVPEGFAAVALLRESVSRRKTDPNALFELRQYLQAKN